MAKYVKKQPEDTSYGAFIGFNDEGIIKIASSTAKKLFGYGDELIGVSVDRLFPLLKKAVPDYNEWSEVLENRKEYITAYKKNEVCFSAKAKVELVDRIPHVKFMHISNKQSEIDFEKKLEIAEIENKNAFSKQNEFVANVTHELRTPVNGIKGHVVFMMEKGNLDDEQLKTLKIIEKCCHNMEKIINNILDFSKLDAGKIEIETEKFSFSEMLEQVINTNIKQANQKGIVLTASAADNIPDELYGDSLRIGQILNNLVSNAIKFTSVGSVKIEVTNVAQRGNEIELFFMVTDTGIGIAKEDMSKLFKSFSQVDGSITRKYGGTGLGLAITKQLVEMMGGTIRVESEKGKGSTFAFSIIAKTSLEEEILEQDTTEEKVNESEQIQDYFNNLMKKAVREDISDTFVWGTEANKSEIKKSLDNLVLCIEMGSWEKAEDFITKIETLTADGGMEIKKILFKMKMVSRHENYEQSMAAYKDLETIIYSVQRKV